MKSRLIILLACLLLIVVAPFTSASTVVAQGKAIIVTSTADSGSGTLRQAILDAHSGDIITFDPVIFPPDAPATIYLTKVLPVISQGNLTIDASNAGVILDGSKIVNTLEEWVTGLVIKSDRNTIRGLHIVNFSPGTGIGVERGFQHNIIGGDPSIGSGLVGQGNLIGNVNTGIGIFGDGTSFNIIKGNSIGTELSGKYNWGGCEIGIHVLENASQNIIGPGNIIAHNNVCGIEIQGSKSLGNTITQNSIHDNNACGISLCEGGNAGLPAPVISDLNLTDGTVTGSACPGCTIEIFSDSRGEGKMYEGRTIADGSGLFTFSKGTSLVGSSITATATDAEGNTSGFSSAENDTGGLSAAGSGTDRIITGEEVWEDETITDYRCVIVERGASLTLRNVTLTFDKPINEECGIYVSPGGSLAIYNSTLSRTEHLEKGGFIIQVEENASFVMKDSVLDGASRRGGRPDRDWGDPEGMAALTLDNVKGAIIEGNLIKHIYSNVIVLHDVTDSLITNNTITPLRQVQAYPKCLSMWNSDNNTITDNHVTGIASFIAMWDRSTGNYVADNEVSPFRAGHLGGGIWTFEDSNNNVFTGNKISGPTGCTGFRIFTRNNVITNNTIRDLRFGIVLTEAADGNIVANNNISHMYDEDAILVYRSSGNYIINNNITSSVRGISVSRFSHNNVIQANTVSNSRQGILIALSSDDNLIVNNEVSKNEVGIMVYQSSGNKIYDNSFVGNSQQGYDDGENIWSQENRGNYWNDYREDSDTAYNIAPAGMDEHPLTESVPVAPVQVLEPAPLTFREICIPPSKAIKGEVKLEDTEILMENSYWIPDGGKLILENVTLRSYKESAAPYEIKVEGGTLIISNSRIIAPETGIAPISITAEKDSTLVIKDSEFHHIDGGWGVEGQAILIKCNGAVIEGNIITDSKTGVYISEGASSARVVNNTVEGCLEAVWSGNPFAGHEIEGNTVCNPVPIEQVSGFWRMIAVNTYRLLLYWLKDPRVIAGLSVIGIGIITLAWFLIGRRRRRKAMSTDTS